MFLKIYIASSLDNRERAQSVAASVRQWQGFQMISDWHEDASNTRHKDSSAGASYHLVVAEKNLKLVEQCDVLVFLNHPTCRGSLIETGYALGAKKHVICSDGGYRRPPMLATCLWVETAGLTIIESLQRLPLPSNCERR